MKTFIVILKDRKFAEYIENNVYKIFKPYFTDDYLYINELRVILLDIAVENKTILDYLQICNISDFMDMVNNDDINLNEYFISYVFVK